MLPEELVELAKLIQRNQAEAQTTEVKAAHFGCPTRLYDTLSSFSNQDSGGTLVFGLDESDDFRAVGVYDLQDLQKKVTEQCNQMEPPVRAVFTFGELEGALICSAEIPATDLSVRPCYYKGAGKVRGAYVRVGEADLPMTDYEIYSYESYRKHQHDDERPVERADLKLMDQQRLEDYIRGKKMERPQFALLERSQMLEMLNITRQNIPTLAAVMNFFFYPQGIFPQLGITAIAVPGLEIGDSLENGERFLDNKRIEGTISEMVEEAVAFCKRNMRQRTIIDPETGKRQDKTEYPVNAIREAVLNALIHRDYSVHTEGTPVQLNLFRDRLEIHSPGSLYGRMTVEQLGIARPDLRNPALAIIAEGLTQAENRYSGIPTIRRAMKEWGLPAPVFENRRNEFVVTLYNCGGEVSESASNAGQSIDPRQPSSSTLSSRAESPLPATSNPPKTLDDVLEFCSTPRLKSEIAEFLGVKTRYYVMHKFVNPLLEAGKLKMTIPEKPQSKWQRYYKS